ncbi:MAG: hypothetical protein A2451_12425 [Bdellovibrionales bacterium RIFOXYC2_FULL_39_8]|nr:MAG: hypothetical protein A2485_04755 [Bdellovibrionales bacterium RIFOXYC12_FULL_39_17]OFZ69477.1 MAG: hypothetical protein A2451_12425 [Bdellovibrionales bacterium RIFOXYC2_FULL_39_8]HLE12972.1 hypothetical protein [Bacteriovoracaceae bacterium]
MKILLIVMFLTSCSSMKKTIIYSSLIGGVAGATSGALLSPNKESQGANAAVFGLIGAGVAALTGYALYQDDPRNYQLKNMLLSEKKEVRPDEIDIGLGNLNIQADLKKVEGYKVPLTELPEKLKGKVNKQYLIKYQSKERYVKNGNKTFYIPPFEIYEHSYDEKLEVNNGIE